MTESITKEQPAKNHWPWSWLTSWTRAEWVPAGIVIFWTIFNCVFAYLSNLDPTLTRELNKFAIAIFVQQSVLISIWIVFSCRSISERIGFGSGSAILVYLSASCLNFQGDNTLLILLFLTLTLLLSICLFSIVRLITSLSLYQTNSTRQRNSHLQFSILKLLYLTTYVAIVLSLLKFTNIDLLDFTPGIDDSFFLLFFGAFFFLIYFLPAIPTILLSFAILNHSCLNKIHVIILTYLATGLFIIACFLVENERLDFENLKWIAIVLFVVPNLVYLSSAIILRWAGYQITSKKPPKKPIPLYQLASH